MAETALKNAAHVEKKIETRPHQHTDLRTLPEPGFIETSITRIIWGTLDHCRETSDMALLIGSSGLGKSKSLEGYPRPAAIIPCSIVTRSLGALLALLNRATGNRLGNGNSNYFDAEMFILHVERSPRLLVFDDSHFLKWELLEFIRHVHDRSGCGVVLLGQEVLYDKMLGNRKNFLWDQLTSRIGIHQRLQAPTREDVELVCRNIFPALDEKCLEYLSERATGPGKLRAAVKLLGKAVQVHARKKILLDVKLLKEVDELFSFKAGGWL